MFSYFDPQVGPQLTLSQVRKFKIYTILQPTQSHVDVWLCHHGWFIEPHYVVYLIKLHQTSHELSSDNDIYVTNKTDIDKHSSRRSSLFQNPE